MGRPSWDSRTSRQLDYEERASSTKLKISSPLPEMEIRRDERILVKAGTLIGKDCRPRWHDPGYNRRGKGVKTLIGIPRFPNERPDADHPDDARHWAVVYAEVIRTLPDHLRGSETEAGLRERLEFWEQRLRQLLFDAPNLVSRRHRAKPANVRRTTRSA